MTGTSFVPYLFSISGRQVPNLGKLWCTYSSNSDHNVRIWNLSVAVIV